ncbi:MAG: sigma 54-interacting transcriptional regulator [Candidatus Acidiferrales bacterium]|jgi:two-component system response regulator AtoC
MVQAYSNGFIGALDLPPEEVIFGDSPRMAIARSKVQLAAATNVPVLLQGESGTGKEILARLLHIRSPRAPLPWVKVVCPAIPNTLIESELFGYEKGAFTGANSTKRGRVEQAHNGTLFLDEIGGLDPAVQAKLLQLLQDGTFMRVGGQEMLHMDARIISSANIDLKQQTEDGSFRLDFLYRLNAVTIDLPPLRKRIEDLPVIVDYLLSVYVRSLRRTARPLGAEMMALMRRFDWPGNIRQLENMIRSYVLLGSEDVLAAELVPKAERDPIPEIDLAKPVSLKQITKAATAKLERDIIQRVLEANGGSRRKTAQWLNISYRSLLYKLGEAHFDTIQRAFEQAGEKTSGC